MLTVGQRRAPAGLMVPGSAGARCDPASLTQEGHPMSEPFIATETNTWYAQRCKAATTAQGLDPALAALDEAFISVHVEQTGGFTMVAYVDAPDGSRLGITRSEGDGYFMVEYGPDVDDDGETVSLDLPLRYLAAEAQRFIAAHPELPHPFDIPDPTADELRQLASQLEDNWDSGDLAGTLRGVIDSLHTIADRIDRDA